jgi:ubiquitin carboxyl-terminal hydrolase 4/11/15
VLTYYQLLVAEVWSHKFYKYYEDYMNLTELAEKDVLVVYELPIPLKSAAKPVPYGKFSKNTTINPAALTTSTSQSTPLPATTEQPPFILPVFHGAPAQRSGNTAFGVPMLVVISAADACSREKIYRAVVERCERWSRLRADFWRYRGAANIVEDELEEVVAEIRPDALEEDSGENVMEIRPAAWAQEEWKLEMMPSPAAPDVEMVDTAQSDVAETLASTDSRDAAPTLGSDAAPTISSESVQPADTITSEDSGAAISSINEEYDPYEIIGPQEDLFDLKLFNSGVSNSMETGFNMNPGSGRYVDWATREPRVSDIESEDGESGVVVPTPMQPLLKPTDALICQWQPTMSNHFFSVEDSLFDRWETFVHPEVEALRTAQTKSRSGKQAIDIEDCLNEFTKEEQLGEDDLWYCPRCKEHQQATKKFELWSVPDILVVHLKRFSNARAMRDKIDALVDFPIEGLDLGQRVGMSGEAGAEKEEYMYDLFAVDEHMGGLGGGHYRAYAKNPSDAEWYHFDDSYVTKSSAEDSIVSVPSRYFSPWLTACQNANAYLLFYRRRSASPNTVIDKVRARISSIEDSSSLPSTSKSIVDITTEPVVQATPPDDFTLPTFDESTHDTLVPESAYDLNLTQQYRSQGSDDDPFTNTNTPSPGSGSSGSANAAYDSAEDKDFGDSSVNAGFSVAGGPVTEIAVTVVQETTQEDTRLV